MSNRQERIKRKERQRAGEDAFVHVKPTTRVLAPVPVIMERDGTSHLSRREAKRRERRYGA